MQEADAKGQQTASNASTDTIIGYVPPSSSYVEMITRPLLRTFAPVHGLLTVLLSLSPAISAWRLEPADAQRLDATDAVFGGAGASVLEHPADWSRDIYPIPVHSHNDYWRDVPVLDALSHGVYSIESDVWLNPDDKELYVGHDPFALTQERTFDKLTLAPLRRAVDQANAANHLRPQREEANFFAHLQQQESPTVNQSAPYVGFFSAGAGLSTPIQLLIDIKTNGNETFPHVVDALKPLADKGYLTRYDAESNRTIPGPLLIIGTGNTPAAALASLPSPRFIFLDCPLGKLDTTFDVHGTAHAYDAGVCGIASASMGSLTTYKGIGEPTDEQRKNLTQAIEQAHTRSIKTRVWDTPFWPVFARDNVNRFLLTIGSDWINADDLDAITKF